MHNQRLMLRKSTLLVILLLCYLYYSLVKNCCAFLHGIWLQFGNGAQVLRRHSLTQKVTIIKFGTLSLAVSRHDLGLSHGFGLITDPHAALLPAMVCQDFRLICRCLMFRFTTWNLPLLEYIPFSGLLVPINYFFQILINKKRFLKWFKLHI